MGNGECSWLVTFDTNAGDLPMLQASIFEKHNPAGASPAADQASFSGSDGNQITVDVTQVRAATSEPMGGYFALSFRGARTTYMRFDAAASVMEQALESLDTIGDVVVHRSKADENQGFTWSVTFLTELGDVPAIVLD